MRRRLVLVAAGVVVAMVVAALVVVLRGDDGSDDAAPSTTSRPTTTTSTTTTLATTTTDPRDAPVDLTFTPRPGPTARAARACLARPQVEVVGAGPSTVRLGRGADPPIADGTTLDARGATWTIDRGTPPPTDPAPPGWVPTDGFRYPIDVRPVEDEARAGLCLVGGTVVSPYEDRAGPVRDALGWELLWHKTTGASFRIEQPQVIGTTFFRNGDGIDLDGGITDGWTVRGVLMAEVHDDCIEADQGSSGRVEDSLLDGCYQVLASDAGGAAGDQADPAAPRGLVTVSDSLLRLQAFQAAYRPDKYGSPSHGQILKWDADAPRVELRDTTVRADALPFGGGRFLIPPGTTCDGATFVWGGSTPLPEQSEEFRRCFDDDGEEPLGERITTDTGVWDDAVEAWRAARPDLGASG